MNIAILKADVTRPPVREKVCDVSDLYKNFLNGHKVSFFDVRAQDYPTANYDLYVITGSAASAYESTPWVQEVRKFIQDNRKQRFLGICFGHQIIAEALEGKVEKAKSGWNLGCREVKIKNRESWMNPWHDRLYAIFNHQDQVTKLPSDAVLLAGNDRVPVQMYRIEDRILCMQHHPEYIAEYQKVLMEHIAHVIKNEDAISDAVESYQDASLLFSMRNWVDNFFDI